jgi:hypothetical protein
LTREFVVTNFENVLKRFLRRLPLSPLKRESDEVRFRVRIRVRVDDIVWRKITEATSLALILTLTLTLTLAPTLILTLNLLT